MLALRHFLRCKEHAEKLSVIEAKIEWNVKQLLGEFKLYRFQESFQDFMLYMKARQLRELLVEAYQRIDYDKRMTIEGSSINIKLESVIKAKELIFDI